MTEPQSAKGNLAVLVNTTQPEYRLVPETIFAAFNHLGVPYAVCDLSQEAPRTAKR